MQPWLAWNSVCSQGSWACGEAEHYTQWEHEVDEEQETARED